MKNNITLLFILFYLFGCKYITIENGRIPDEFLTHAKIYQGTYYGNFETHSGKIDISFKDGAPELVYTDKFGNDILDKKCQSQIGQLKSLILLEQKNHIFNNQAVFAFNPGSCKDIQGHEITLSFKDKNNFTVRIYNKTVQVNDCRYKPCQPSNVFQYSIGSFSR